MHKVFMICIMTFVLCGCKVYSTTVEIGHRYTHPPKPIKVDYSCVSYDHNCANSKWITGYAGAAQAEEIADMLRQSPSSFIDVYIEELSIPAIEALIDYAECKEEKARRKIDIDEALIYQEIANEAKFILRFKR